MEQKAAGFFGALRGKRISVIGVGVSNTDLIRQFAACGAAVTLCDRQSRQQLGDLCTELEGLGVTLRLGEGYLEELTEAQMVVRAPGVYFHHPALQAARAAGVPVTSEMELFCDLCPCPIYAVTGSDGKTTTTSIIAELLRAAGRRVHLGGNIGRALLPVIGDISPDDRAVVELSSFQLISMRQAFDVAVVTNVTPNHLDVHGTMEEYITAKEQVLRHQNALSRAVLSADNPTTAAMAELVRGELRLFSRKTKPTRGAFATEDGGIYMACREGEIPLMTKDEIRIPGWHNVENYLAAISAVWGEVSPEQIRRVAREFPGVEHRIEFVRELDGVRWYNDSIATSPTRVIAGLQCFPQKIIIIAGGYDKKIPFEPLAAPVLEHVKTLVLTGATAAKIEAAITAHPDYDPARLSILHAADLADAVAKARAGAQTGDVISLSPACASFDCYPNFMARGEHFKQIVSAL